MQNLSNSLEETSLDTTIILATYNWSKALEIILLMLSKILLEYPSCELIIADDGSNYKTLEIIKKHEPKFKFLRHIWQEDQGFRKARILNQAILNSKGKYLIFLDGDCIPFKDFIHEHLRLAQKGYFVAGNRILLSKDFTFKFIQEAEFRQQVWQWGVVKWLKAWLNKNTNKLFPSIRVKLDGWRYLRSHMWKYPKGCNFAAWREDIVAINGFDESFDGWGHEDTDLFIRLLNLGIKIKDGRFSVPVLHLWHEEASRAKQQKNWQILLQRLKDKSFIKSLKGLK